MTRPPRSTTLSTVLDDLLRISPLISARVANVFDRASAVEHVVLAENFERLRRCPPHAMIVLHAEAAAGGWSLATALNLAWERHASAVVVTDSLATPAGTALAERLDITLIAIEDDPIDVAMQLAGLVSAPDVVRAMIEARCAARLAEESSWRGVLGVLNAELHDVPIALLIGSAVVAGNSAATAESSERLLVTVDVTGSREREGARLIALVPVDQRAAVPHIEALLRLARPAVLSAWAHTRLDSSQRTAQEKAAFNLLRRRLDEMSAAPAARRPSGDEIDAGWLTDLGWQFEANNRAVWIAPIVELSAGREELTALVRATWLRRRSTWPLIAESDGWISWHSTTSPDDTADLKRAITAMHDLARVHQLVIGVGRAHLEISGLMQSVAEARLAAQAARGLGPASVQWFDHVGPRAALAWLPVAEIAPLADLCLGDLTQAKDNASLINTVLAVLDCGGSLSRAAARLGIHRNTVLSRLGTARRLGLDIDDADQRLAIHVLCHAVVATSRGTGS